MLEMPVELCFSEQLAGPRERWISNLAAQEWSIIKSFEMDLDFLDLRALVGTVSMH